MARGLNGSVFPLDGKRRALLAELWPGPMHWQDVLDALNAIPEGDPVTRGTMMAAARAIRVRRPFPPGRFGREAFLRAAALMLLLLAIPAWAAPPPVADPSSPTALWYRSLKQPGTGVGCCDLSDCRQTTARLVDGAWRALTPAGIEVDIPPHLVLHHEAHPGGAAVLCWLPTPGVLCFVPPQAGG
jgi:hypothetical protein